MLELDFSWTETQYTSNNEHVWRAGDQIWFVDSWISQTGFTFITTKHHLFPPHFIFYLGSGHETLTRLEEADLKNKNPNNVSLVSCAEHALKWNVKSLSHLSTWKRFTSDWEEFIRKTHHSSPAQERTTHHTQLSTAKFC